MCVWRSSWTTIYSPHTPHRKLDRDRPNLAKVSVERILAYSSADIALAAGDAFVRELDVSKITLRLKEKQDKKGDNDHDNDHTIAKLQGNTLDVLQRCLVRIQRLGICVTLTMTFTVQTNRTDTKGC